MWTGERERLAPESSRPRSRRSGRIPAEPYPPLRPRLVYSHGFQAASARILFHWPCRVVTELSSGKGMGTR